MAVESPVGKQIREVLATSLRRDPSSITPEHSLREDLGLDSLMTFELLYDLEKAFDMEIPNDDLPGLLTLGDVVKYVEGRVNPSAKTSAPKSKAKTPAAAKPAKTTTSIRAKKTPKATQAKPKPKAKAATPAKAKNSTSTGKTRVGSSPTKPRSASASTKRVTATTAAAKKRTTAATPKAKKK